MDRAEINGLMRRERVTSVFSRGCKEEAFPIRQKGGGVGRCWGE